MKKTKLTKTKLECPKCHKVWAELSWAFDRKIEAGDIKVLIGNKKFKNEDDVNCTSCGYGYTNWDIMLALAGGINDGKDKKVHI